MRYYFQIQWRRFTRWTRIVGLRPALMLVGSALLFSVFCVMVYRKTAYASWILALLAVLIFLMLGHGKKYSWLKVNFGRDNARKIRLLENLISALPFVIAVSIPMDFEVATAIILATFPTSFMAQPGFTSRTIPTPFGRHPFEFAAGFRRTFPMIAACYALTAISILVDNSNLGIFSILVIYLTIMTFYAKPEARYFAWLFSDQSRQFLIQKLLIGLRYGTGLVIVQALLLSVAFPGKVPYLLLILLIGSGYTASAVLSKYAYYPSELPIAPALVLGLSVLFPPLMVITLPLLFRKANRQMKLFLP